MPPRRRKKVEQKRGSGTLNENCAASYPATPTPVIVIGDPGSGVEYVTACLGACPGVVLTATAFAESFEDRVDAVASIISQAGSGEFSRSAYAVPDLARNFSQTLTQLCRETAGWCNAIVLQLGTAAAEAQGWFSGDFTGVLSPAAVVLVYRHAAWASAQAAWGNREIASRVAARVDPASVMAAAREQPSVFMRARRLLPRTRLEWNNDDAWLAYRALQGRRERLLAFAGVSATAGPLPPMTPPLRGDLSRWISNAGLLKGIPSDEPVFL